jgi:hypothetical protein
MTKALLALLAIATISSTFAATETPAKEETKKEETKKEEVAAPAADATEKK